jgi:large subunit ribosomal protein L24
MAARIRKGDTVEVTAGKDRGRRGAVLSVDPEAERVVVERLNMAWKHQRPTGSGRGGRMEKENPLHISNVALVHKGERTRVRFRVVDGKKVRWSVRHDEAIDG